MRASSGSGGRRVTRPTTVSASSIGHPAAVHASSIPPSSSAVRMSSRADATMSLAPSRSRGASRVTSDRRVSTVARGRGARGALQQVRVAVVDHPVLRPAQARREPAAHRRRAAARSWIRGSRPPGDAARGSRRARRSRRRVGRLTQREPVRADADDRRGHRAAPVRTPARTDVGGGHPRSDARRSRAARRSRPRSSASPSQSRSARRAPPGRRAGPGAPAAAVVAVPIASATPPTSVAITGSPRQGLGDDHPVGLGV